LNPPGISSGATILPFRISPPRDSLLHSAPLRRAVALQVDANREAVARLERAQKVRRACRAHQHTA